MTGDQARRIQELENALHEALDGWQSRVNRTRREHPAGLLGAHPEDADEDDQIQKLRAIAGEPRE